MRELAFERKRELYSAGRYFIPPFKLPPGFRFASEEQKAGRQQMEMF